VPSKKRTESQHDKFKDLARKLGTHDEEERFKKAVEQALRWQSKESADKKPTAKKPK
jgi:ABC-type hemin transport system substrate-binding protein